MTRETRVGAAAIAALVGIIGWSVAEGLSNRPPATEDAPVVAAAPPAAAPTGAAEGHSCCKDKAHADHKNCKMKAAATSEADAPRAEVPKCPYMARAAQKKD